MISRFPLILSLLLAGCAGAATIAPPAAAPKSAVARAGAVEKNGWPDRRVISLDVLPFLSADYSADDARVDAELSPQPLASCARSAERPYFSDTAGGELRFDVLFPAYVPASRYCVMDVVNLRPRVEVVRVNARWIVAGVADQQVVGDRTLEE